MVTRGNRQRDRRLQEVTTQEVTTQEVTQLKRLHNSRGDTTQECVVTQLNNLVQHPVDFREEGHPFGARGLDEDEPFEILNLAHTHTHTM